MKLRRWQLETTKALISFLSIIPLNALANLSANNL